MQAAAAAVAVALTLALWEAQEAVEMVEMQA
jgi:hypothetical protein